MIFPPNNIVAYDLILCRIEDKMQTIGASTYSTDPFTYPSDFLGLAAGTAITNAIQIQSDSDFILTNTVRVIYDNAAPPVPNVNDNLLVLLTDAGSGRTMMSSPVHIDNLFGTAQQPFYWQMPKYFASASTFQVQVTNNFNVTLNVRLAFNGFKVFYGK